MKATFVRYFGAFSGTGEIEAVAVDDALGYVYYADEGNGIRKYHADPDHRDAASELAHFGRTGFRADREGIAIYAGRRRNRIHRLHRPTRRQQRVPHLPTRGRARQTARSQHSAEDRARRGRLDRRTRDHISTARPEIPPRTNGRDEQRRAEFSALPLGRRYAAAVGPCL